MYHGMLCGMAAFKEHAIFGFWKGPLVVGSRAEEAGTIGGVPHSSDEGVGSWLEEGDGRRHQEGHGAERSGRHAAARRRGPAKPVAVPDDLAAALRKNKKAQAAFEKFPPSHKREYVEWITQAKREETRARRLQTAIQQISEGKPQNWKYMK